MKTLKLTVLSALVLFCVFLNSLNAQWVQVPNGMGNRFISSLAANSNTIFAGAGLGYGVYLSANNGTNWTQTSLINQNVLSLAVNGNNVFAGTWSENNPYGVYFSTNNGTTWTQTSINNIEVYALAVSGNNVYAGTWDNNNPYGVYYSTNNGTTWSQTTLNNVNVPALAVNGNNVFAGTSLDGVYLSTNNGISWVQTSLNNQEVDALAVNGNNVFAAVYPNGLYLSTNNGTNWTQTSFNIQVISLAVTGNNVFAGTYNGVYVSNNNGGNWIQRNEGLPPNTIVPSFCISGNYIFASEYYPSVYRRPLGELTGIQPVLNETPSQFSLSQNYPNPFNPVTNLKFQIPKEGFVKLTVLDVLGREISVLVNEQLKPGTYNVDWNASNYTSGVYFYTLSAGEFNETRKAVLIK